MTLFPQARIICNTLAGGTSMTIETTKLKLTLAQAAHHLHAVTGNIATMLIDTRGRMLFSNSALSYVDGTTLSSIAKDYAGLNCDALPCTYIHTVNSDVNLYLTVIDGIHVFIVVGSPRDEMRVQEFNERLRPLLRDMLH